MSTDLRYGGKTLTVKATLSFLPSVARVDLVAVGHQASLALWEAARGPDKHMALVTATAEREAEQQRVRILVMVNTPEELEQLQPRIEVAVKTPGWNVTHCEIAEVDLESVTKAWAFIRDVARPMPTGEPS